MAEPDLIPQPEPPPMSAPDALHRLGVMLTIAEHWSTHRRGQMAELMGTWAIWLRGIKPHVEAAEERSNDG